jgi:hypothetical protein
MDAYLNRCSLLGVYFGWLDIALVFGCSYSILALAWHAQLPHRILAHDLFLASLAHAGNVSVRAVEWLFMLAIFTQKPN